MSLETGTYVADLVTTNPPGTDKRYQGDDHLRLIKTLLKATFPNADRAWRMPEGVAAKTANYSVLTTDDNKIIPIDATSGIITVTLPAVSTVPDGFVVTIWKSDSGANEVIVDGNGAETVNNATDRKLSKQYQSITLVSTGSLWLVLSERRQASAQCGRLSLTTALPVTPSDVTGATTIYFVPYFGNQVPLYNGLENVLYTFSELSLALDSDSGHTGYHQSGKIFDLFIYNDAGTLRLCSGPAWTSDTARADAYAYVAGYPVNNASIVLRFGAASGNTVTAAANTALLVGCFRATANGQATDSAAKRLLANVFNKCGRALELKVGTDSWTYSTATIRQANADTANKVEFLVCLAETIVSARSLQHVNNNTSTTRNVVCGLGYDSTTALAGLIPNSFVVLNTTVGVFFPIASFYTRHPAIGYHYLALLEKGNGTDTQTWWGDAGVPTFLQTGIEGEIFA